jgi:hypothetical protein
MKTLVIYDTTGRVLAQINEPYQTPTGIPYIETEVPQGKYIESINVKVKPNTPVFKDYQVPESEKKLDLILKTLEANGMKIAE